MKPSELKKDGNFSGRINNQVKGELKKAGITVQEIIDAYIERNLTVEIKVKIKPGKKK